MSKYRHPQSGCHSLLAAKSIHYRRHLQGYHRHRQPSPPCTAVAVKFVEQLPATLARIVCLKLQTATIHCHVNAMRPKSSLPPTAPAAGLEPTGCSGKERTQATGQVIQSCQCHGGSCLACCPITLRLLPNEVPDGTNPDHINHHPRTRQRIQGCHTVSNLEFG